MTSREKFETWVMTEICISKSTLDGLRTENGYRNSTLSGTDYNRMWSCWQAAESASEQQLEESRREFRAADATIHNLELQITDMAVQLANAESKCRELAAENAHARERHVFIRALAVSILEHSGGRMDWRGAMEDATELLQTVDSVYAKTPATDAFLAEVRAQGVEMMAAEADQLMNEFGDDSYKVMVTADLQRFANAFAAQLRKGAAL